MALSLIGKKSNFKSSDLIDYFAKERLELNNKSIDSIIVEMNKNITKWKDLIEISFLSDDMKNKYLKLFENRINRF